MAGMYTVLVRLICITLLSCISCCRVSALSEAEWPNHGGGILNRRQGNSDGTINPSTAASLALKWQLFTGEDVTASPSITDGILYFPTWNGSLYAVREEDGHVVWKRNLTEVAGSDLPYLSRHTPVIVRPYLLVGIFGPGVVLGLDIATGNLKWSTTLDRHPSACITMSGSVHKGAYYVGVASQDEASVLPCCSFQGSMVKLDVQTGKILWQTSMLPDNGGDKGLYSGAALWGSSPSIDELRKHVYIASGNLYSTPPNITKCQLAQNNKTIPDNPDPCIIPGDHSESILALDLDTGNIVWSHHLGGYDTWNLFCIEGLLPHSAGSPNCPPIAGPDYDFGEAPMMLTIQQAKNVTSRHGKIQMDHEQRDVVVAGQKSGFVWALDRDDGSLVWGSVAGPGGALGGASWGAATDGERIYTNIINNEKKNFTLAPTSKVITSGGWVALNASTGEQIWSVAAPDHSYTPSPVSVVDGVVLGTSEGYPYGSIYALEAQTGAILWNKKLGASLNGGVSIHGSCIYLGEGLTKASTYIFTQYKHGVVVNAFCV